MTWRDRIENLVLLITGLAASIAGTHYLLQILNLLSR